MKNPIPTDQRDSKGRRLWQKWCSGCDKTTIVRFEKIDKQCISCAKAEGKGFPPGVLIDPEFECLKKWSWRIINSGYVYHTVKGLLHRYVTKAPKGYEVNHKNRNKLDCRRENLEVVTTQQNAYHRSGRVFLKDVDFF